MTTPVAAAPAFTSPPPFPFHLRWYSEEVDVLASKVYDLLTLVGPFDFDELNRITVAGAKALNDALGRLEEIGLVAFSGESPLFDRCGQWHAVDSEGNAA